MVVLDNILNSFLIFPAIFAMLMTIVTSFYYIRLVKNVYFEKKYSKVNVNLYSTFYGNIVSILTLLLIYIFINPTAIVTFCSDLLATGLF